MTAVWQLFQKCFWSIGNLPRTFLCVNFLVYVTLYQTIFNLIPVATLQSACRDAILQHITKTAVSSLPLPKMLKEYLLYQSWIVNSVEMYWLICVDKWILFCAFSFSLYKSMCKRVALVAGQLNWWSDEA